MNRSPQKFDRRNFLTRSSLLFAAAGVGSTIRFELLEKISKKMGIGTSELYATELGQNNAQFCIELVMRAGFPMGSFVAPQADTLAGRVAACSTADSLEGRLSRRAAIHLPSELIQIGGSGTSAPLFLSPYAQTLIPLIEDGTLSIAGTLAIRTNGGHSSNFATRNGAANSGLPLVASAAPCPAIHFASVMPKSTILNGVEWKMSDTESYNNCPGGFDPLTRINGNTDQVTTQGVPLSQQARNFLNLFSPAAIPFSSDEVTLIASASEKLNQNFITYRAINNSDQVVAAFKQGTSLLTTDYRTALIPSMQTYTDWQMSQSNSGVRLAEAMYMLTKAFSLGLIRAATITVDTGDWHGRLQGINLSSTTQNRANNSHAVSVRYISNALARAYSMAKDLPNPHAPGKSVAEGLVTVMTSEFTRGMQQSECADHTDGGSNGCIIIGPTAKNTSAYNWDPATNSIISVDRITGALDVAAERYSTATAYSTICHSLGIPAPSIGRFTSEPPLLGMLKS